MLASSLKGFLMLLWSDTKRRTPLYLLVSTRLHRGHTLQSYKDSVGVTDSLMAHVVRLAEIIPDYAVATNTTHACHYTCNICPHDTLYALGTKSVYA